MTAPRSLRDSTRLRDIPAVNPIRERSTAWTYWVHNNRGRIFAVALVALTCVAWGLR